MFLVECYSYNIPLFFHQRQIFLTDGKVFAMFVVVHPKCSPKGVHDGHVRGPAGGGHGQQTPAHLGPQEHGPAPDSEGLVPQVPDQVHQEFSQQTGEGESASIIFHRSLLANC